MRVPAAHALRLPGASLCLRATGARHASSKAEKRETFADAVDSVLTADLPRAAPAKAHGRRPPASKGSAELFAGERIATSSTSTPKPVLAQNPLANKYNLSRAEFRSSLADMKDVRAPRRDPERTLLSGPDEKIKVGAGYVFYAGPAPEADTAVGGVPARNQATISYARLRDACPCPRCIDPSTRQKTHTSGEAWRDVRDWTGVADSTVMHVERNADGEHGVTVHWPPLGGEPHTAFYPVSLLRRLASRNVRGAPYYAHGVRRQLWDRDSLLRDAPDLWTDYRDLHDGAAGAPLNARPDVLLRVLEQLQRFGLAVVRGVPTDRTGNKDAAIRALAEAIGPLRNTFYGETWNVQSVPNSKNVAYTSLNLGLHMDLW